MTDPIKFEVGGIEFVIPSKQEKCWRCDGRRKHGNPAFDGCSLFHLREEHGPEFLDEYRRGLYDVVCKECKGVGTLIVPDRDLADPETLRHYDEQLADLAECDAIQAAERRAESGYACYYD